jgi:hypothetical protein
MRVVLWDEITQVWIESLVIHSMGIPIASRQRHRIQTRHGEMILTEAVEGIEEVVSVIVEEVSARLTPAVEAALDAGKEAPFGPFMLSAAGVTRGRRRLDWDELTGAEVSEGAIRLFRAGRRRPWASEAYRCVPNAEVFLRVVGARLVPARKRSSARV